MANIRNYSFMDKTHDFEIKLPARSFWLSVYTKLSIPGKSSLWELFCTFGSIKAQNMLPIQKIRQDLESIKAGLRKRGWNEGKLGLIDEIISLDDERKSIQARLDEILSRNNTLSKEIGDLFKKGAQSEANALKEEVGSLKVQAKSLEEQFKEIKEKLEEKLLTLPNVPHKSVPAGISADDNEVYKKWDQTIPGENENWLPHWELAKKYQLIDFELGASITGSGFPLFQGKGAKLNRALINFFLDEAESAGYTEIRPPFLVNEQSARATGQLPDKDGQMYYIPLDKLYLIPTGEVPLTNMFRDMILEEQDLPIKITGQTPCFRREAGSYGSDVKGLNRVHQLKLSILNIRILPMIHS